MRAWSFAVAGFLAGSLVLVGAAGVAVAASASASSWTLASAPLPTLPGGQIRAVSCSSAGACTAVGTFTGPAGINRTLAERWNGRTWQQQSSPDPALDTNAAVLPDLTGVSCPASNYCEAVGFYQLSNSDVAIAQAWNGRGWKSQQVRVPVGATSVELDQVSCVSSRFCEAVGSYDDSFGDTLAFAARWDGASWHLQQAASPATTASVELAGVSCVSPKFCEAAGGSQASGITFAERWNGTSWQLQAVPGTGGANAVSCVSVTLCEAVGSAGAEQWNGSSWKAQPVPAQITGLTGVSCVSAKFCETVGLLLSGGSDLGAAAKWNGSAWKMQSMPNPAKSTDTSLRGVSCVTASSCKAAGFFEISRGSDPVAVAEAWRGKSWQLQAAAKPAGATTSSLTSVSCASASFCEAVGSADDSAGSPANLAEQWDGKSWQIQVVPDQGGQSGLSGNVLDGVSCVSAQFCEAVGDGPGGPIAEKWNGASWELQTRPGTTVEPIAVSCATIDFCMTVNGFGQVDLWDGSSWSASTAVTGFSPLTSVSCVSATFCEAVGGGPSGENAAMWNGLAWSPQATAGTVSAALSGISCASLTSCEAVGSDIAPDHARVTMAQKWNGTTWALLPTPNPAVAQGSSLQSVWCTSADDCTSVGSYQFGGIGLSRTLGEVWNGATWSLRTTPSNVNAGQNDLVSVSCGAAADCLAVGQTQDEGLVEIPLTEAGD
jgi:hypothetical protein